GPERHATGAYSSPEYPAAVLCASVSRTQILRIDGFKATAFKLHCDAPFAPGIAAPINLVIACRCMALPRPQAVVASEIVQLLLLAEPLWRAFQMHTAVSIIGAAVCCGIAAVVVLEATRRKRRWARTWLAVLALCGLLISAQAYFASGPWQIMVPVSVANAVAVALLFTNSAENWFEK